jgi:hypothetical protein
MHRLLRGSVDGKINRYYESPKYRERENEEAWDGIMICHNHIAVVMEWIGDEIDPRRRFSEPAARNCHSRPVPCGDASPTSAAPYS